MDSLRIILLCIGLGSDDFAERESCQRQLAACGRPAARLVAVAAKSNDPEVAGRAKAVLASIGVPEAETVSVGTASPDADTAIRRNAPLPVGPVMPPVDDLPFTGRAPLPK